MTAGAPLLRAQVGSSQIWCSDARHGNVGDHVGDDPQVVARNRAALASAAGLPPPTRWVWVRQVHGRGVHVANGPTVVAPEADAAVTTARGLPLAIVTADCAPIVLASDDAVAVVHAGHPGLAAGVIAAAADCMRANGRGNVRAFLGPCIHPARYEFGAADLAALVAEFGDEVEGRTETGRPALDIPAAVRVALHRCGIGELEDCGVCTSATPTYFSHRRDGHTGRQVTIAMLP